MPATAGIGAANAAIAALIPILAVELKPLRVNGVSPGVIDTPWWDAFPEGQKRAIFEAYSAKTPVGRLGRPEDVAHAIAFLIGDSFMSGHILVCDGGLRLSARANGSASRILGRDRSRSRPLPKLATREIAS